MPTTEMQQGSKMLANNNATKGEWVLRFPYLNSLLGSRLRVEFSLLAFCSFPISKLLGVLVSKFQSFEE